MSASGGVAAHKSRPWPDASVEGDRSAADFFSQRSDRTVLGTLSDRAFFASEAIPHSRTPQGHGGLDRSNFRRRKKPWPKPLRRRNRKHSTSTMLLTISAVMSNAAKTSYRNLEGRRSSRTLRRVLRAIPKVLEVSGLHHSCTS